MPVAVDFVIDVCGRGAGGKEFLNEEEVWSRAVRRQILEWDVAGETYDTVIEALG